MPTGQSALILPVPEADVLVASWRARFDKHAAQGVPAHITLLAPFLPVSVARANLRQIRSILGRRRPRFSFDVVDAWPDLLVLRPQPDQWFRRVSRSLCDRWGLMPYGGRHGANPKPHLTIAYGAPVAGLTRARFASVTQDLAPKLPVQCVGREVQLLEREGDRWVVAEEIVFDRD